MANGVNTKLAAISTTLDGIYTRLGTLLTNNADYADAAATHYDDFTTLSGFIQLAIGTFSEAEPGTVLATLRSIALCVCTLAGGAPPTATAPNGCTDPFASDTDALAISTDYPNRAFVTWPLEVPQGITFEVFLDPPAPTGSELHITSEFPYYLWVQSSCPNFQLAPLLASVYPTNRWVQINGLPFLALNLDEGCSGRAFICTDPETGFVDCIQRTSSVTETVHATVDNSDRVRLSVPLDGLGLPLTDTIDVGGGNSLTSDSGITWVESDANGYSFEWISGARIRIWWKIVSAGFADHVFTGTGSPFTITDATTVWGVDNWQDPVGDVEQPFEVRICPPAPA
jgi:hypothetical protein